MCLMCSADLDDLRAALIRKPRDAAAYGRLIHHLVDDSDVFRWFFRQALLVDLDLLTIEGDVLRRAMLSSGRLDTSTLRRIADSVEFEHRGMMALFTAAALLVCGRLNEDRLARDRFPYRNDSDNLSRAISLLFRNLEPQTAAQAFSLCVLKQDLIMILRAAGFMELVARLAEDVSIFVHSARHRFNEGGCRILSHRWTFAIGHLVLAAVLIRGAEAGVLDFRTTRIWDSSLANDVLRSRFEELSTSIETVPMGAMFAEGFTAFRREWIDGRFVDQFEACGIIADHAGDAQGAILARPDTDDRVLSKFFRAIGIGPSDRIVTLHCRAAGFRRDRMQDLRNVDIAGYLPAIRALAAQGYRVIRMGDPSMPPLPSIDGVFDYALSPLKSQELDVQLPGVAHFHIGCSSGLSMVPLLYATPTLFLNWATCDLLPWGRRNCTVLKPITAMADRRRVTGWSAYSRPGQLYSHALLTASGHGISDLDSAEVTRAVTDFVATLEAEHPEPPKVGRNLGPVLLADDDGHFHDLRREILAGSPPGELPIPNR